MSDEPETKEAGPKAPPGISPYVPTAILFGFAAWFGYDGWFNPETKSVMFNRVMAPISLLGGIWDFVRMRRKLAKRVAESTDDA